MKCPVCLKAFDAFGAPQYRTPKGLYIQCPHCNEQIFVGKTTGGTKVTRKVKK